jgi:hypothetical protein
MKFCDGTPYFFAWSEVHKKEGPKNKLFSNLYHLDVSLNKFYVCEGEFINFSSLLVFERL